MTPNQPFLNLSGRKVIYVDNPKNKPHKWSGVMKTISSLQAGIVMLALGSTTTALAGVQFRIAYENSSNEYVVYMTPDSAPSPDMTLSSQVTLVVPHRTGDARFAIGSIRSDVGGVNWANHSRVDAPAENSEADYVSFGLLYAGGSPPVMHWVAGQEKRMFSFASSAGCVGGVALLNNNDPFNQLPNSMNTNPGNEYSNTGWIGNAYNGNYGSSVTCGTNPPVDDCEKNRLKLGGVMLETVHLKVMLGQLGANRKRDELLKKLAEFRNLLSCRK